MLPINEYYDSLAPTYDADRFGNAYGRYVDALERAVLRRWLGRAPRSECVDLGCGTGRLLEFAGTGVDGSAAMLAEARRKHSASALVRADLGRTGLADQSFDAAICFHVLMHLDAHAIESLIDECARIVRPGGRFVFDIPSRSRRDLIRRPPSGWHGDTSATIEDVRTWARRSWRVARWCGIVFFPIHRVPNVVRPVLTGLDSLLGRTPVGRWSSYLVCELERRS